jgi:hypothetical protein
VSRLPVLSAADLAATSAAIVAEAGLHSDLTKWSAAVEARAAGYLAAGRSGPVGTLKQCREIVHGFTPAGNLRAGLSNPSKMPGRGWSLPALLACPTGASLAKKAGTICSGCYATKGRYTEAGVAASLRARWDALQTAMEADAALWVAAMARLISTQSPAWFRWHDSGDLFADRYVAMVLAVCSLTPSVQHWIPTKETSRMSRLLVRDALLTLPENVTLRLSAPMLHRPMSAPAGLAALGVVTSSAGWDASPGQCPAPTQGGECRECRSCWDRTVPNANYIIH